MHINHPFKALESNNKWIRNFASFRARKTSGDDQCTDIMARLLERSDPFQLELRSKYHLKRGARKPVSTKDDDEVLIELNELVDELLIEENEN